MGTQDRIIGIFHGTAAYLTLNDKAYGVYYLVTRAILKKTSDFIDGTRRKDRAIAVSMKNNGWGNEDLLLGVKVNAGAVGRLIQLVQEGYIQIQL